jgi:hypothetical protein
VKRFLPFAEKFLPHGKKFLPFAGKFLPCRKKFLPFPKKFLPNGKKEEVWGRKPACFPAQASLRGISACLIFIQASLRGISACLIFISASMRGTPAGPFALEASPGSGEATGPPGTALVPASVVSQAGSNPFQSPILEPDSPLAAIFARAEVLLGLGVALPGSSGRKKKVRFRRNPSPPTA